MMSGRIACITILAFSILYFLMPFSHAQNTGIISVEVSKDGMAVVDFSGKFYGNSLIIILPYDSSIEYLSLNLQSYRGSEFKKACESSVAQGYMILNCTTTYDENVFSVRYETSYYVWLYQDELNFIFSLPSKMIFSSLEIRAIFPAGYVVEKGRNSRMVVFPPADKVYLAGEQYVVVWELNGSTSINELFVSLRKEAQSFRYAIFLPIFVGLLAIGYLLLRRKRNGKKDDYGFLLEDERKVLKVLEKKKDYVRQKEISQLTGFSKAKVSRLVKTLEMRGLVEVAGQGRNKRVRLKK